MAANRTLVLYKATNGDLFGTTAHGGANNTRTGPTSGCGTVFKITPAGTLTTLYSFCSQSGCMDGQGVPSALVQANNGDFYGTTSTGGISDLGTVFKITASGTLTTLYSFCSQSGCADGEFPMAGLVQATNGDLYGTTSAGGANACPPNPGCGTVFKITPSGTFTTLYSFCSQSGCADGEFPLAGLVQATNGDLYGTTSQGGANGGGTVFKITASGTLTTLYPLCSQDECFDGGLPYAAVVQTTNGDLYGTTGYGGALGKGTVFKITPSKRFTTLYSFCSQSGCTDGDYPFAALVQATDGNLFGTTNAGGANACPNPAGCGTVFKITPNGTLTTLYSLCSQSGCSDGELPFAGLAQATNGKLYGTAFSGGPNGDGTAFSLSVGLGPFVETQTTSGRVGASIKILGTDLTGAISVTFNGTAATFTVVSRYLITTTVPAGATTGSVQVVTPSRTLQSNAPFRVLL
ncbi:MAG: choice-of-anchor tandem repeat GloVer-containing protein [Bryobacteraceae bacterium]